VKVRECGFHFFFLHRYVCTNNILSVLWGSGCPSFRERSVSPSAIPMPTLSEDLSSQDEHDEEWQSSLGCTVGDGSASLRHESGDVCRGSWTGPWHQSQDRSTSESDLPVCRASTAASLHPRCLRVGREHVQQAVGARRSLKGHEAVSAPMHSQSQRAGSLSPRASGYGSGGAGLHG